MMQGYLTAKGVNVQRQRVRDSIKRIDPEGCNKRWSDAVHRRSYHVPTPNSFWHIDGHMKLVRWGFVTHGCIDGYSRLITFLRCGLNNTSSSVLRLFVSACSTYGIPSRVRSDYGGENTKVALFLNLVRERSSHITGKSVHNQRIERLWKDVHYQVTGNFYDEFYSLEEDPQIQLDMENQVHRKALHYVYLPVINEALDIYRNGHNEHKVRSAKHKTPHQLWLSGMLDNMCSNYTATKEAFGPTPNIMERLDVSLARFGLTLEDVNETPQPDIAILTEQEQERVDMELLNLDTTKEKFKRCIEILNHL